MNQAAEDLAMYLRFVVLEKHPDTGVGAGLFGAAYRLQRNGSLSTPERDELLELLDWFGTELSVPERFSRSTSKGHYRRATKGISWLKDSAADHVQKMHRLAQILRDHGHHVEMVRSANPGYLVYEDEHQIVAEPFNDMLKRV
ncbi:hypothetical protein [Pelagibius sp. 7325]|uniref:hypothetical protein n=1 Tax=Pelagibius sp. 7325 TaxID=3131994 RepID=UPI0030EC6926